MKTKKKSKSILKGASFFLATFAFMGMFAMGSRFVKPQKVDNYNQQDVVYALPPYIEGDSVSIEFYDQGGGAFSGTLHEDQAKTHTIFDVATYLLPATKEGYSFGGWYDDINCTGEPRECFDENYYPNDLGPLNVYAKWTVLSSRTISKGPETNGTFTLSKSSANAGEEITVTASPNSGYGVSQIYYTDSSQNTYNIIGNTFICPDDDVTVYVIFSQLYSLSTNGVTLSKDSAVAGEMIEVTPSAAANGYQIAGVYYSYADENTEVHQVEVVYDDMEGGYFFEMPAYEVNVYVETSPITYTITIHGDGIKDTYQNYTIEDSDFQLTPPTRDGYHFIGWQTETDPVETITITQGTTGDLQYTALFEVNYVTVTFVVDGETYATRAGNYGAELSYPDAPTKTGYTFTGWSQNLSTIPAENTTITANFAVNQYTIYIEYHSISIEQMDDGEAGYEMYSDNGTIAESTSITQDYGTALNTNPPTIPGYTFHHWAQGMVESTVTFPSTMPVINEGGETFYACYTQNTYTVTVQDEDGNVINTFTGNYGDVIDDGMGGVLVNYTPSKPGYTFTGYNEDIPETLTENLTLHANFTINQYTINVYYYDNNSNSINENLTITEDYGTALNITAPEIAGYIFDHWALEGYGTIDSNALPTTMPAGNYGYIAFYTFATYTLTFDFNDGETDSQTSEVRYTASFETPYPTREGYIFLGWYDNDGNRLSTQSSYKGKDGETKVFYANYNYTENMTFTARWAQGGVLDYNSYDRKSDNRGAWGDFVYNNRVEIYNNVRHIVTQQNPDNQEGTDVGENVKARIDGDTLYIFSCLDAKIFLPESCYRLFGHNDSIYDEYDNYIGERLFRNIQSIDLSAFDSARTTNMSYMFYFCYNLTDITFASGFGSAATNMSYMFYYCGYNSESTFSLDLRNFNTENVTNMSYMFHNCNKLTSIDLSSFNTSNVKDMRSMFESCYALQSLDLSNFNTSNVTNMSSMFYCCSNLTSLDLSSFDMSKVTSTDGMFNGCSSLESITLPSTMPNSENISRIELNGLWRGENGNYSDDMLDFNASETITKIPNEETVYIDCYCSSRVGGMGYVTIDNSTNNSSFRVLTTDSIYVDEEDETILHIGSHIIRAIPYETNEKPNFESTWFTGWTRNSDGNLPSDLSDYGGSSFDIYAHFDGIGKEVTFTINPNYKDGDGNPVSTETMTVRYGDTVTLPTYDRDGYVITSWNIMRDGSSYGLCYSNTITFTYDTSYDWTFTANWTEGWTLNWDLDGGDGSSNRNYYTKGQSGSYSIYSPSKAGYEFTGWTFEGYNEPVVLRKIYITADKESGDTTLTLYWGEWQGYDWSKGGEIYSQSTSFTNQSVSFLAHYQGRTYDLRVYSYDYDNDNYLTEISSERHYGDEINLTAPERTGYTFHHWYYYDGNDWRETTNDTLSFTMPDSSLDFTAYYTRNTYNITLDANGGECDTESATLRYGDWYELPTPTHPDSDYRFLGWYYDDDENDVHVRVEQTGNFEFDVPSELTLTAHWGLEYTATVYFDCNGSEYDGDETFSREYENGEYYEFPTPDSRDGYRFVGWFNEDGNKYLAEGTYDDFGRELYLHAEWEEYAELDSSMWTPFAYVSSTTSSNYKAQTIYDNVTSITTATNMEVQDGDIQVGSGVYARIDGSNLLIFTTNSSLINITNDDVFNRRVVMGGDFYTFAHVKTMDLSAMRFSPDYNDGPFGSKMFGICTALEVLDISSFDFGVEWNQGVFDDCDNLRKIYLPCGVYEDEKYNTDLPSGNWALLGNLEVRGTNLYDFKDYLSTPEQKMAIVKEMTFDIIWDEEFGSVTREDGSDNFTFSMFEGEDIISVDDDKKLHVRDVVLTATPNTEHEGYIITFEGWIIPENIFDGIEPNFAKEGRPFTITFEGEDINIDDMEVIYGDKVDLPVPEKTGYTFLGWTFEGEEVLSSDGRYNKARNISVVANWELSVYRYRLVTGVIYDENGNNIFENEEFDSFNREYTYTYENEETITLWTSDRTIDVEAYGYEFLGWTWEGQDEPVMDIVINPHDTGDHIFYANFRGIEYTVNLDANGGEVSSESIIVRYGQLYGQLPTPVRKGYRFVGWFDDNGLIISTSFLSRHEETTITAQWSMITYTITTIVEGKEKTISYNVESDDITLENPTKPGLAFIGWSGTGIEDKQVDVTIYQGSTGNRTYTAHFELAIYTITLVIPGNPQTITYTSESEDITLPTDLERQYYTFDGWRGEGITTPTKNVVIPSGSEGNRTYTAVFTPITYTITLTVDGVDHEIQYTTESNNIEIDNPTKEGYKFAGWVEDDSDQAIQELVIGSGSGGDKHYTATWSQTGLNTPAIIGISAGGGLVLAVGATFGILKFVRRKKRIF